MNCDFFIVITQNITKNNKSNYKISTTFLEKLDVKDFYISIHSLSINVQPNKFVGYFAVGFPRKFTENTRYKVFKIVCDHNPKSVLDSINNIVNKMYVTHADLHDEGRANIRYFGDTRKLVMINPRLYWEDASNDVEESHVKLGSGKGFDGRNLAAKDQAPIHIKLLGNTATILGFEDQEKVDIESIKDLIEKERPGSPFQPDPKMPEFPFLPTLKSKVKVSKKIVNKSDNNFCFIFCKTGKQANWFNNEKSNLLGIYRLNKENEATAVEVINEIYVPVNSSEISTIELELYDSHRNKLTLEEGLAVFVLHLKRFN